MPSTMMNSSIQIQTNSTQIGSHRAAVFQLTHSYHSEMVNCFFKYIFSVSSHIVMLFDILNVFPCFVVIIFRSTKMCWLCLCQTFDSNRIGIAVATLPIFYMWTHTNSHQIFVDQKHSNSWWRRLVGGPKNLKVLLKIIIWQKEVHGKMFDLQEFYSKTLKIKSQW